jgi:hypothetical protein
VSFDRKWREIVRGAGGRGGGADIAQVLLGAARRAGPRTVAFHFHPALGAVHLDCLDGLDYLSCVNCLNDRRHLPLSLYRSIPLRPGTSRNGFDQTTAPRPTGCGNELAGPAAVIAAQV